MVQVPSWVRLLIAACPELTAVLAAAATGLPVQPPLAWLAARQGINVLPTVLVFATAVTIEPAALHRLATTWRPLPAALATDITVLPALAWAASRIVPAGPLRDGVMTAGLAPCEIGPGCHHGHGRRRGRHGPGVLIGSTVTAAAGPILIPEASHAAISPGRIIASLAGRAPAGR